VWVPGWGTFLVSPKCGGVKERLDHNEKRTQTTNGPITWPDSRDLVKGREEVWGGGGLWGGGGRLVEDGVEYKNPPTQDEEGQLDQNNNKSDKLSGERSIVCWEGDNRM